MAQLVELWRNTEIKSLRVVNTEIISGAASGEAGGALAHRLCGGLYTSR